MAPDGTLSKILPVPDRLPCIQPMNPRSGPPAPPKGERLRTQLGPPRWFAIRKYSRRRKDSRASDPMKTTHVATGLSLSPGVAHPAVAACGGVRRCLDNAALNRTPQRSRLPPDLTWP